jgi:hypothetical protein
MSRVVVDWRQWGLGGAVVVTRGCIGDGRSCLIDMSNSIWQQSQDIMPGSEMMVRVCVCVCVGGWGGGHTTLLSSGGWFHAHWCFVANTRVVLGILMRSCGLDLTLSLRA